MYLVRVVLNDGCIVEYDKISSVECGKALIVLRRGNELVNSYVLDEIEGIEIKICL